MPNSPLLADNYDPQTRDFRSLTTGTDVVDAQVLVALQTVRASGAAVMNDGMRRAPRKMLDSLKLSLESEVRVALGRLTARNDVRLARVVVRVDDANQTTNITVVYLNLRVGKAQLRTVTLEA